MAAKTTNTTGEAYKREPITVDGLTVKVFPKLSDDYKMFRFLAAPDTPENNIQALEYVFGDDLGAVEKKFTDENGFTSVKAIIGFMFKVINKLAKN